MGEVVQIRDYQSKRNLARAEKELEQQALEIMNVALMGEPGMVGMEPVIHIEIPYGGQGIDGMQFNYTAPDKDPA